MQLRHALIPYIYSMAWRAHQTGISLVTPMYYGNWEEPAAFEAKGQYYFGTELIAAPVTEPGNRKTSLAVKRVWLPSGVWYNFFTGQRFTGGQWHELEVDLEDIPVFAKAGAIVPLAPKAGWGGIENPAELDLHIFLGADNTFDLYEDDGETTDYERGKYAITRFSLEGNKFIIHPATGDPSILPYARTYRIHIHGVDKKPFSLSPFSLTPDQSRTIEFPRMTKESK
jgi:alpha-glucosidase (family GH31 glycosyl hydrolase)